jgi:glycosyl transferase family 1
MNVFVWHVHGAWTTAFVHGPHTYFVPVNDDRGPDGRGRARTYEWPANAVEVTRADARDLAVDVVVLQRPEELATLAEDWLGGRRPGRDVPAVYVEHNAPQGRIAELRHPAADRRDLVLVHVTHFNDLFWDAGTTRTRVIEHGVVDPGRRYTGELARAVAVINEPVRRGRVTGTDLLPRFAAAAPIDVFGIDADQLPMGIDDIPQSRLHDEMARRRVYVHPLRWTSLGLSLIEAMHLGMPVVALATTEACEAVPRAAGAISTNVDALVARTRELVADPAAAREAGSLARQYARGRYGLVRFLRDWDALFAEVGERGRGVTAVARAAAGPTTGAGSSVPHPLRRGG